MRPFVSGLVLAAGASTRLGQPKQLLPFGATTLLGTVVSEARAASALDEVIVVLGGAAAEVRRGVELTGAKVVENPEFADGCSSSYPTREVHPLVFARALFETLGALRGDKAAWKIVDAHRDWVRPVPVDRPHPRDVNTREEYEALLRNAGRSDAGD